MSLVRNTAVVVAGLVALGAGVSAFAQVDLRAQRERDVILQQQDMARQDALASQRELSAAQSRYDTQLTLRSLNESARPASSEPTLRPTLAAPPRGPSAQDVADDAARMERLTDQALAASNARLRAVTPAN